MNGRLGFDEHQIDFGSILGGTIAQKAQSKWSSQVTQLKSSSLEGASSSGFENRLVCR